MILRIVNPHAAGRPIAQISRTASSPASSASSSPLPERGAGFAISASSVTSKSVSLARPFHHHAPVVTFRTFRKPSAVRAIAYSSCSRSTALSQQHWGGLTRRALNRVRDRDLSGLSPASISSRPQGRVAGSTSIRAESESSEPSPAAAAPAAGTVSVAFRLTRQCAYGQKFFVSGAHEALGGWDLEKAIPAEWSEGHVWTAKAMVPRNASLPFKCVMVGKRGEVEWQQGGNHCLDTTAVGAVIDVDVPWSTADALVISNRDDLDSPSAASAAAAAAAAPPARKPAGNDAAAVASDAAAPATPAAAAPAVVPAVATAVVPSAASAPKPLVAVPPRRPAPLVAAPPARPVAITAAAAPQQVFVGSPTAAAAPAAPAAPEAPAPAPAAEKAQVSTSSSSLGVKEATPAAAAALPKQRKPAKPRTRRPRQPQQQTGPAGEQ
ncbi:hypothetical protein CLOM_g13307 [Closterium sp. NIES-68]|nr:hypothetical protein CLOM_g13307 [Closterium sp. NIES-68]GJP71411.1 hypothetical protein CLOP_g2242 [Closterium sp. NIES-67]